MNTIMMERTTLHEAVAMGNSEDKPGVVQLLLVFGQPLGVNILQDKASNTALHLAIQL